MLLLSMLSVFSVLFFETAKADPVADVYVDDDQIPGWYNATHVKTIQEGIDNATIGQIVYVYNGSYNENVYVNKSLDIQGENRDITIINGSGGNVVHINVSNVSFSGFSVTNGTSGGIGLYVYQEATGLSNITILSCTVHSNENRGIFFTGDDGYPLSNSSIANCIVYSNLYGIHLDHNSNCSVLNCDVTDSSVAGISLSNSDFTDFMNCSAHGSIGTDAMMNPGDGFSVAESHNCSFINCSAYNNTVYASGFRMTGSTDITWRNNTIYNNTLSEFYICGDSEYCYRHDIDTSNTIRGKPMYYYVGQDNVVINETDNAGYIGLVSCNNASINNSNVSSVVLAYTTNSTVDNVTVWYGSYSIFVTYSSNNNITDCFVECSETGGYAIYLEYSYLNKLLHNDLSGFVGLFGSMGNNNTISENNISNCAYGIFLSGCSDNLIYHNSFINNTDMQACDMAGTNNSWDNGAIIGGNYWSDYHNESQGAWDNDSDGFADDPYNITTDAGFTQDNYPLMEPWVAPAEVSGNEAEDEEEEDEPAVPGVDLPVEGLSPETIMIATALSICVGLSAVFVWIYFKW